MQEFGDDPLEQVDKVERGVVLSIAEKLSEAERILANISDGGLLHRANVLEQFVENRYIGLIAADYTIRANIAARDNLHQPRSLIMQAYLGEEIKKVTGELEQKEELLASGEANKSDERLAGLLRLRLRGAEKVLNKYRRDEEE